MALTKRTPTASTSLEGTLTRPDSVTVVTSTGDPVSDADWTTLNPKVLYTAPSDCKYVKIYWRKSTMYGSSYDYAASYFPRDTTTNRYYGLNITDGTFTREIYRGNHHNMGDFALNAFTDVDINNSPVIQENDTVVYNITTGSSFFISGDMFTLAPGEKLQLFTGDNSFTLDYFANFEAWVYN